MERCHQRLQKLVERLEQFVDEVNNSRSVSVRTQIDPYFYVQKVEELRLLLERIGEVSERLNELKNGYKASHLEVFHRWRSDVRWLNSLRPVPQPGVNENNITNNTLQV